MSHPSLLPAIHDVLEAIRHLKRIDEVVDLILAKACALAQASHGSFVLVDHEARRLTISNVFGADWTLAKKLCQLPFGQGLTGKVAETGRPLLCRDTVVDPDYYALFDYVRSELVVPVNVNDKVWGLINIDCATPYAFDDATLQLLTVFSELAASAITLRLKMNDQDRLYKKLLQSEKMASLGEAIAGIAHEINNPLSAILGHAQLLGMNQDMASDLKSIDVITSESHRAAGLIRSLLDFSRKETGKREWVDLQLLVNEVVGLKKLQLRMSNIKLLVSHGEKPCPVLVCPQRIKQVLINLITNAEQATPKDRLGSTIHLTVERQDHVVQITVSDNGGGITPDARKFIFDPFFTTKAPGEGTGLGLSISYAIMAVHGGSINLTSSTPAGTTFTLEFPVTEMPPVVAEAAPGASAPESPPTLEGSILLVDDEPHILEALAAYLSVLKIPVQCAPCGPMALKRLKTHTFDLVVTDIRMPDMDGIQFYEAACRTDPRYEKRFVFMSGYLMRESVRTFLSTSSAPCLEKPFTFDELRRTLVPFLGERTLAAFPAPSFRQDFSPSAHRSVESRRLRPPAASQGRPQVGVPAPLSSTG